MIDRVVDILSNIKLVIDIEEISSFDRFKNKDYEKIIKFKLNIKNELVGIIMAIPTNWDRRLIDFFIDDYSNFKFIPHMERQGKICLFELEGVLIKSDFEGVINESIIRLNRTIIEGIEGVNKIDFITEFDSYWLLLPDIQLTKSFVNLDEGVKKIKYIIKQRKFKKEDIVSISDKEKDFFYSGVKGTIKNGIYINIKLDEYMYPPDWRKKLDINYINDLLECGKFRYQNIKGLINNNRELLLFININQPNGTKIPIAIIIKNFSEDLIKNSQYLQLDDKCICIPLYIDRSDAEYLIGRAGIFKQIKNRKVLIIGCGSIGGYLASELVKSGISNLILVDDDKLTSGNIYRHLLGLEYVGQYKTKAIGKYIEKNIPFVNINTFESEIEELIENYMLDFEEFDLVISATGNHNINRWINKYAHDNDVTPPIIYLWNEVLGIGNHALFIDNKKEGCFECLMDEDNNGLYDRSSYCKRGQVFTKKYKGCSSTFLPYGSIHSLKTVSLGVELAIKYFNKELEENILISQKGENTYMVKAGLLTSDRFNNQTDYVCKLNGSSFIKKNCSICFDEESI